MQTHGLRWPQSLWELGAHCLLPRSPRLHFRANPGAPKLRTGLVTARLADGPRRGEICQSFCRKNRQLRAPAPAAPQLQ